MNSISVHTRLVRTSRKERSKSRMDILICTAIVCCSVVASICSWKILNWVWLRPKKLEKLLRQQGFKGNSYKLFYGDYEEISNITRAAVSKPMNFSNDIMHRATPVFHNARKKYGENSMVWFGPRPAIIITEPEIIKEILSKNYAFQKLSGHPVARMLTRGVATYETEKWAKHRKLINPAFHLDKLKLMIPSFYLSCGDMMSKWDDKVAASEGRCELDVWPYITAMTSDVISRTAFGSCYEDGRKIFELQREQALRVMEASRSIYIPGWRFLPTKVNRRMKETSKEIEKSLLRMIDKRMKAMEAGEAKTSDDLLGLLLESNMNEIKQHGNEFGMSIKEVIEECKLFYFAGQETTASLLVWTMILLSKHDDWQARARVEVLTVFGGRISSYKELNQLRIVSMILHETLRLYSPAVIITRMTHKEARFGKLVIPAGVQLMMPVLAVHRDPRIWGKDEAEVERFNPERFSDGVLKATGGETGYFPFGWGPRICMGQNFAMLEAKMAMAMILQRYSFQLSPSYSHAPRTVIFLQPQHGAHLILTKLQH